MKINGTNSIIVNDENHVLLQLRDDKPTIPFPNRWALPGGHIDQGETPLACILREMKEEMGLDLKGIALFAAVERSYGTEHTYWVRGNFLAEEIVLSEGQRVQWHSYEATKRLSLIYEDNTILDEFFAQKPFEHSMKYESDGKKHV